MAKGKKKAKVSKAKKNLLRKGSSKTKTKKPVSKKSKPVKVAKKQKLVVAQPVKEVKNEKEITSEFKIKVENVVSFASLGVEFPLERLVEEVENTEYEPEQFPGLVYRITEPRVAFLLFSSGKIICTGAHSLNDIKRALEKFKERLEEIGIKVEPAQD